MQLHEDSHTSPLGGMYVQLCVVVGLSLVVLQFSRSLHTLSLLPCTPHEVHSVQSQSGLHLPPPPPLGPLGPPGDETPVN